MILMTLVASWLFVFWPWLLVVTCYLMHCFAINTKKLVASILAMESTRVCKLCEGRMHRICLCTSSGTWWKSAWQLGVWNWPCVGPWSLASYCSIYFVINIFSTNRLRSQFPLRPENLKTKRMGTERFLLSARCETLKIKSFRFSEAVVPRRGGVA